jgi:hypothetical protein
MSFEWCNEWKQLWGKYNWYSFTLVNINYEKQDFTHGHEFTFIVLGLGFWLRINNPTFDEWTDEMMKDMELDNREQI